jgi:hypothetical protein
LGSMPDGGLRAAATAPEPVGPEDSATLMPYTLTSAGCLRANQSSAAIANTKGVIAR